MSERRIEVAAAVIRENGFTLICSRPKGTALADFWEFPGGKCEPGETPEICIVRELREELGIECKVFDRIHVLEHDYPDKKVRVHFIRCAIKPDSPPMERKDGQDFKWVPSDRLEKENFLPADRPLSILLSNAAKCEKQSKTIQ